MKEATQSSGSKMKKRICFVVQRYGLEVNGGAELHCRQLAEHLLPYYQDITVLTTKAIDYMSWSNEYEKDEEYINGIRVLRFGVEEERDINRFNDINRAFYDGRMPKSDEQKWIDLQGPKVPKLIDYIVENEKEYAVFIFFTYLYYPTVMGVPRVSEKALVIPTAHDEPFLKMKIFDNVFMKAKAFFFNTEEERKMIHKKYHNEYIISDLGGVGVEVPNHVNGESFKEKYGLDNYVIYVGRIDEGKNCHVLFKFFEEYKKRNFNDLKLILLGKAVIPVPKDKNIISLGFVSDEDKFNGIAGAKMLILPSEFESLSMVVLEAMSLGIPSLVNGKCPVLKGHCIKSNGALYYNNYFEFEGVINYLLNHEEETKVMGQNAQRYVEENYQWDVIMEKLCQLIEFVAV